MNDATPAQLAAGTANGLTPAQCSWLRGDTPEELAADAVAVLAEFAPPPPPGVRVGGPRGVDVASGAARGSTAAGAELYRARNGIEEDGQRPARKPVPTQISNPFMESPHFTEGQ